MGNRIIEIEDLNGYSKISPNKPGEYGIKDPIELEQHTQWLEEKFIISRHQLRFFADCFREMSSTQRDPFYREYGVELAEGIESNSMACGTVEKLQTLHLSDWELQAIHLLLNNSDMTDAKSKALLTKKIGGYLSKK